MRHFKAVLALLPFLFATGALAAEVVVVRGDTSETVTVGQGGLTVLRGSGTMRVAPPPEKEAPKAARLVAGRTLWFVGDEGRPKRACYLARTTYVGERRIRCTTYR